MGFKNVPCEVRRQHRKGHKNVSTSMDLQKAFRLVWTLLLCTCRLPDGSVWPSSFPFVFKSPVIEILRPPILVALVDF